MESKKVQDISPAQAAYLAPRPSPHWARETVMQCIQETV